MNIFQMNKKFPSKIVIQKVKSMKLFVDGLTIKLKHFISPKLISHSFLKMLRHVHIMNIFQMNKKFPSKIVIQKVKTMKLFVDGLTIKLKHFISPKLISHSFLKMLRHILWLYRVYQIRIFNFLRRIAILS